MTALYKELMEIIDFVPDEDEKMRAEKYCKSLSVIGGILIAATILMGLFALYCIYAEIKWGFYAFIVFEILSVGLFKVYQRKYVLRISRLLSTDCNVSKALTAYIVMLQYSRTTKKCDAILACVGSALFYDGRFAECKKVIDLISKYCDTAVSNTYRISLYAMVSLYEKNKETVEKCVNELETLMSQTNTPYMTSAYNVISNYSAILEAEEAADYAKMSELMKTVEVKDTIIKKVSANYRLYKVAKAAGMEAEASKHRSFVVENGGDTFYKRELENAN